jgi:hypothetical protein
MLHAALFLLLLLLLSLALARRGERVRCAIVTRFAIGISENGMMVGPASAQSNAVICSPANQTIGQYVIQAASFAGIVPQSTSGTTGFSLAQANGFTVMTWTRGANNGAASDAQIQATGPTNVIWAIGKTNVFSDDGAAMGSTAVALPYTVPYANSVTLTPGLVLKWNVAGSTYQFQAVLNQSVW